MTLRTHADRCVGCESCLLACSYQLHGGFNPRRADLEVVRGPRGEPVEIAFRRNCQHNPPAACRDRGTPPCAAACPWEALVVEVGKSRCTR